MRNLVYTLGLAILLIVFFSCLGYYPTQSEKGDGYSPKYEGDSGLIALGIGELMAEADTRPGAAQEPTVGEELTPTVSEMEMVQTEIITKEKNGMDGMLLSFWHGVAAVLIGETVCLMVAAAWMKIRRSHDG